ncbi:MAG: glycine betaine transporter [Arenicella sp.]
MQTILSVAIIVVLLTSLVLLVRWPTLRFVGSMPTKMFAFIAILFTSGLDVGLIMFPLTEFPVYETEPVYGFASPLAIEFGFWGFLIWLFYFLTTFYFCVVEPRLKIFEIPWVKFLNNVVIIGTCAFTGYLFLTYIPSYIDGISDLAKFSLVAFVVLCAVLSSTHVRYVKILSISSTWLFFALIGAMWFAGDMGLTGFTTTAAELGEYFTNIHEFVLPMSDYHAFYLFWWFAWSIMIGQFVARFVGALNTWQLFLALLILPSIPIGTWFAVLYYYYSNAIEISAVLNASMIVVGVVFVINSLDSLTRLYTDNLGLTVDRLGILKYIAVHWILLYSLILMYQFTPLKIEWVGLLVIGLYACVYFLMFNRRKNLLNKSSCKG